MSQPPARPASSSGPLFTALIGLVAWLAWPVRIPATAPDSPCPPDSVPEAPDLGKARPIELTVFAEVERSVVHLRGLEFLKPVSYVTLDREHLLDVLLHEMLRSYSREELRLEGIAYEVLGFVPQGSGEQLADAYLALLEEQVGAFYEPVTDSLVTMQESRFEDYFSRILLAHELAHAIDDQHFHLECYPLDEKGNDDALLAISALVEGSATRIMNEFAASDILASGLGGAGQSLELPAFSSERLSAAPLFLREILTFPYFGGQKFIEDLYRFGGYPLVNLAFAKPPRTTEQILHPQKFYPRPEPAAVLDPLPEPPPGWVRIAENGAGELGLRLLFTVHLDAFRAVSPAMGWGGDRWAVYSMERPGQEPPQAYAFDWRLEWDSAADCDEFLAAYRQLVQSRFAGELTRRDADDDVAWTEAVTPAGTLRVVREEDRRVLLRSWPTP